MTLLVSDSIKDYELKIRSSLLYTCSEKKTSMQIIPLTVSLSVSLPFPNLLDCEKDADGDDSCDDIETTMIAVIAGVVGAIIMCCLMWYVIKRCTLTALSTNPHP
jgi:hypothetical protein